jgi:sodium/proline symporter
LVIVAYTFLGGFLAVSFTDFFQGSLMWIAIVVAPIVVLVLIGGFGSLVEGLEAQSPALLDATQEVSTTDGGWTAGGALGIVGIASGLAWGLGYFGQPHILARFMGIRSVAAIPKARKIAVIWALTAMTGAVLVGLVGIVFFEDQLSNPETAFINIVQQMFNPWI